MSENSKPSALLFIIPILLIVFAGAWYVGSKRKPNMELDVAISDHQAKIIEGWVKSGLKYDEYSCISGQYQPLYYAAMIDDLPSIQLFLKDGAKADATDKKGHTALMAACTMFSAQPKVKLNRASRSAASLA